MHGNNDAWSIYNLLVDLSNFFPYWIKARVPASSLITYDYFYLLMLLFQSLLATTIENLEYFYLYLIDKPFINDGSGRKITMEVAGRKKRMDRGEENVWDEVR